MVLSDADQAAAAIMRMPVPPASSSVAADPQVPFVENARQLAGPFPGGSVSGRFRQESGVGGAPAKGLTAALSFVLSSADSAGGEDFLQIEAYSDLRNQLRQVAMGAAEQSDRVARLSDQVGRLAAKVDDLLERIRFAAEPEPDGGEAHGIAVLMAEYAAHEGGVDALVKSADERSELAALFDFVADHDLQAPDLASAAEAKLEAGLPSVRAAAARVLAVQEPDRARSLLPAFIDREQNKLAAAIMRSALSLVS